MSMQHGTEPGNIPDAYGEDRIVLLARDPNCLYAYWEITSDKIDSFKKDFGEALYSKSIPVLKVNNISKNESYYIRINDFSGSWYINVPEDNNIYIVEIGRKISENFFVSFAASNSVMTPGSNMSSNTGACFVNVNDPEQELNDNFETGRGKTVYNNGCTDSEYDWIYAQIYAKRLSELLGISSGSI